MMDDDLRYTRVGWIDLGRKSDQLVRRAAELLPGDSVLPSRWTYKSQAAFQEKYGGLGHILWSKAASSFTLLIGGHYVLRIWIDRNESIMIDVSDTLAGLLAVRGVTSVPIPDVALKKHRPFTQFIFTKQLEKVELVMSLVKAQYGLDSTRV
jgi:hypothetical protein